MPELSPVSISLLVLAALLAGTVDAIGGGGGLVALPALLAAGLPPHLALGTNKAQSVFGSGAALARYARAGLIEGGRRVWVEFSAGFVGSVAGAGLLLLLPGHVLRPLVLILLAVAALMLTVAPPPSAVQAPRRPRPLWIAATIALVLGAYDGFFGPGTGTFLILAYLWLFDTRLQQASADAKVVNFASNLAAAALFATRGSAVWAVALPMAIGQLAGGWMGAHVVVRGGDVVVRAVARVVVAALLVKLAIDLAYG